MGAIPSQFLEILYFLATAIFISIACSKLKITSALGYLIAGVVLGPHAIGLFSDAEVSKHIAEFGFVFLLFTIGLELPWERLQELKRYVFGMGLLQVVLTSILFSCVASYFGASNETAILLGVGLSFSSTAVVLQILSDQKSITSRFGRISFSILLFQDLIVIVVLVWVTLSQGTDQSLIRILGMSTLKVLSVFIGFMLFGRYLLRPLYRTVVATRNSDLFFALTLLIILATSFITESAGLSLGLGAFLAGLLLAETEYRHRVESDIKPFRSLLLGLFFMTVGMSLDPHLLMQKTRLVFSFLSLLLIGKISIFLITSIIMKIPIKTAIRISILMAGGSEFVFVLFKQAELGGLIDTELNQVVYLVVVISMMLSPFLAMLGPIVSKRIGREMGISLKAAAEESVDMKNHVIIVGFNLIGETFHDLLSIRYIPHIILDMSVTRVAKGRLNNFPIFFGDAKKVDVFHALNAKCAKAIVISLEDFNFSIKIATLIKKNFPNLKIFVRVQDTDQAYKLQQVGATPVAPEMFAPSFQLASAVFETFGMSSEQIDISIEKYKRSLLSKQKHSIKKFS
ncbi:monovalent cation:proton antiporter-2 (CPA2) family protein [Alphaproteobacteria bacterium]|nr:monovalent cation:proton antiporter-2 (CPA2) family protein [Alphaproteobacteria bacterium]